MDVDNISPYKIIPLSPPRLIQSTYIFTAYLYKITYCYSCSCKELTLLLIYQL
jgi:hypothetical protein